MDYKQLRKILDYAGNEFYGGSKDNWRPTGLIPDPYRREALKDAQARFRAIDLAEDALQTLTRAPVYIGSLKDMRHAIRRAMYAWRSDDLAFIEGITDFYTAYGTVLQHLHRDQALGHLEDTPE